MNKADSSAAEGLAPGQTGRSRTVERVRSRLKKRHQAERRFRLYGRLAISLGLVFLGLLFFTIVAKGYTAFEQSYILLEIDFSADQLGLQHESDRSAFGRADYGRLVKASLRAMFPEVKSRREKRALYALVSPGADFILRKRLLENPDIIGTKAKIWVPANDDVDMFMKGRITSEGDEASRRLKDNQLRWIDTLIDEGRIEKRFNTTFFTAGDSRDPELAGIRGAAVGSFYTLLVTVALSFPIGVAAAIYLEEFAPRNRLTDVIEVNINNLAAVPSIVFGLLGLAVFLNFLGLPRSAPIVGGLVLSLMTLPTIIIAGRAALTSVPPSIREAALGVGASPVQTVLYHVLPLAMPGMLTGTILGMARALGETAPLLMIGMVAFIVDIPSGIFDPATVLPVQIYLWADSPERGFAEKTAAAIMVLLLFLIAMNSLAVFLRKRFERRW
jgi:phosphate transport system permease protein